MVQNLWLNTSFASSKNPGSVLSQQVSEQAREAEAERGMAWVARVQNRDVPIKKTSLRSQSSTRPNWAQCSWEGGWEDNTLEAPALCQTPQTVSHLINNRLDRQERRPPLCAKMPSVFGLHFFLCKMIHCFYNYYSWIFSIPWQSWEDNKLR